MPTVSDLRDLVREAADFIEAIADDTDDPAGATAFAENLRKRLQAISDALTVT